MKSKIVLLSWVDILVLSGGGGGAAVAAWGAGQTSIVVVEVRGGRIPLPSQ